jgi:starch-binding outer membrane protein, SusD/RagB family
MNKLSSFFLALLLTACQSLIEVDYPDDQFTTATVFEDDATATNAIRGIYAGMAEMPYFSNGGIALLTGLSSDEFFALSEEYTAFYHADIKSDEALLMNYLWRPAYGMISSANAALKGLGDSRGTTKGIRQQLIGEAYFIRAFSHFYLTNLFGPIPLLTQENFEQNAIVARTNQTIVYDTIEADLIQARDLMSEDTFAFTNAEAGRIRPTTWAASALLARVYLYRGKWALAEAEATRIIGREDLFSLAGIEDVFNVTSHEAIWQLKANTPDMGTWDAALFLPAGDFFSVALRPEMLAAFEPDDQRRAAWIDSLITAEGVVYYPTKYKSQYSQFDEYHIELRLAELSLIRAEARARLNDLDGALADLDVVRARAGLPLLSGQDYTVQQIINATQRERRAELFAEGGHRWFDLKRHDGAGAALSTLPDKDWQDTDVFYPIPQSEIEANPNLAPQNDGY